MGEYLKDLPMWQKPRRPIGHEEVDHEHQQMRVIIDPATRHQWPRGRYSIRSRLFTETAHHRQETRWSRRKHPAPLPPPPPPPPPPIVWEGEGDPNAEYP